MKTENKKLREENKALKAKFKEAEKLVAELITESYASVEYRDAWRIKWNAL